MGERLHCVQNAPEGLEELVWHNISENKYGELESLKEQVSSRMEIWKPAVVQQGSTLCT